MGTGRSVAQTGLGGGADESAIELSETARPVANLSGKYGEAVEREPTEDAGVDQVESSIDNPRTVSSSTTPAEETAGEVGSSAAEAAEGASDAAVTTAGEVADTAAVSEGFLNPLADIAAVGLTAAGIGMTLADVFKHKHDHPAQQIKPNTPCLLYTSDAADE